MNKRTHHAAMTLATMLLIGSGALTAQVPPERTHLIEEPSFEDVSLVADDQEALETQVAMEQLLSDLDSQIIEGPRDDGSERTALRIRELVDAELEGSARLESADCSSRLCRLDLTTWSDDDAVVEALLEMVPDEAEAFVATRQHSEGTQLLFYMSRDGSGLGENEPARPARDR